MFFYVITENISGDTTLDYKVIYKIAYIVAGGHIRTIFFLHRSFLCVLIVSLRKDHTLQATRKTPRRSNLPLAAHSLILISSYVLFEFYNHYTTNNLSTAFRRITFHTGNAFGIYYFANF